MSDYTPTEAEIIALRRAVGEYPAETSSYTDADLTALLITREGDIHAAAYDVWMWKAAAVSGLFDWSADGGDYKQSVLYDRYLANAAAEKAQSPILCGMIIDPTLGYVEEGEL